MSKVAAPFAPLYHFAVTLAGPVFRWKTGFVPASRVKVPKKGPFVVLCQHGSNYDFVYAMQQCRPRRLNAVVSQHFFVTGFLGWLLRLLGCIPIRQFTPDPPAVRSMLTVIREGRGLLIFPEAEVNGQGRGGPFLPGLPRLLKMLKAPVYFMRIRGAYLTSPKWAKTNRRGRIETELFPLFSAEELSSASYEEIAESVARALAYDEGDWQREAMIPFRGKRLAEGIENMLHRCAKCGALYSHRTEEDTLICTACGNRVTLDEYGFLHPVGEEDRAYPTVSEWVQFQQDRIREEIASGQFCLSTPVGILVDDIERKQKHVPAGEGVLTLDLTGFRYEGTLRGEAVTLTFPIGEVFKCPFSAGKDLEIPNTSETLAFVPQERRMISHFVQAVPVLRESK